MLNTSETADTCPDKLIALVKVEWNFNEIMRVLSG